jgi:hypothetical protein
MFPSHWHQMTDVQGEADGAPAAGPDDRAGRTGDQGESRQKAMKKMKAVSNALFHAIEAPVVSGP